MKLEKERGSSLYTVTSLFNVSWKPLIIFEYGQIKHELAFVYRLVFPLKFAK